MITLDRKWYTLSEAQSLSILSISMDATQQLKELLETKHLYQHSVIDDAVLAALEPRITPSREEFVDWARKLCADLTFSLADEQLYTPVASRPVLTLVVLSIKIFCPECDSAEAFNPVWFTDVNEGLKSVAKAEKSRLAYRTGDTQTFLLVYQCQRCRGIPQSFLVKREGWKLYLHGRSPMEHIEIPKYIPKAESRLYRDALIAHNTGKHLAALFYLRSFIEQFARRVAGISGKATGDSIMDAYNETVPSVQREQMPSLREWYDKLSEPIHAARDDEQLFRQAQEKIERHFDIRRVFEIPETPPERAPQVKTEATKAAQ